MAQVKARVFAGMNQLWKVVDNLGRPIAWCTTFIYTADGNKTTAQINLATSDDMDLLVDKMPEFERWAMDKGYDYIEITGRLGWLRVMRNYGFEHNYTSLLKRVSKELH